MSRNDISKSALKVLYRLKDSGFQAFLVGGGVRDLMLGLHPKDFDIATDAHPEEIYALFRNSRMIGRRFRLVHVRFGREIIEVATFRGDGAQLSPQDDRHSSDSGRLLRDNVYGGIDDDVWRRDFTVNALYYNIADFSVWDYTGGVNDVRQRQLKLIGDPERRLREDPVRMLRAIRFAAKLDFEIDAPLASAIRSMTGLLADVPAARLFDEFLKLFQAGFAQRSFDLLESYGLLKELFGDTTEAIAGENGEQFRHFIELALANTDRRVANAKGVTPMFLIGVFLWGPVRSVARHLREHKKVSEIQSLSLAAYDLVGRLQSRISVPKRFSVPMREMLALQPRFRHRKGKRASRLLEHPRFRAAYDFMVLRSETGEIDAELAQFWTEVQEMDRAGRAKAFELNPRPASRKKRPRKRRRSAPVRDG